jgi:hypothetical protein
MNKMHPSESDGADPLARANHLAKQMARARWKMKTSLMLRWR